MYMKTGVMITLLLLGASCTSSNRVVQPKTYDAKRDIEEKWKPLMGKATKQEFVQEYGAPSWCEFSDGKEETCRFHKTMGEKWVGDRLNKRRVEIYDEVVATFSVDGTLKTFDPKAQR